MDKYFTAFPKLVVMLLIALLLGLISSLGLFNDVQSIGLDLNLTMSRPFVGVIKQLDQGWSLVTNLQGIQVQNLALQDQVAQLSQQLANNQSLQTQNQLLLSQLNLQLPHDSPQLLVPVVSYEYVPSPGYIFVRIGPGSTVAAGDLAIRYNYIVGEVTEIVGDYARVRLITANDTSIPVKVGDKGVIGKLTGNAGLDFKVEGIDQSADVAVGDEISLLDSNNQDLRGYNFGTVSQITGLDSDTTQTLVVNNPVEINNLDFVIIVPRHV